MGHGSTDQRNHAAVQGGLGQVQRRSWAPDRISPDEAQADPIGCIEAPPAASSEMSARNFASSNTNLDAGLTSGLVSWGRGFTVERSELSASGMA
jgi:hypothetical protein